MARIWRSPSCARFHTRASAGIPRLKGRDFLAMAFVGAICFSPAAPVNASRAPQGPLALVAQKLPVEGEALACPFTGGPNYQMYTTRKPAVPPPKNSSSIPHDEIRPARSTSSAKLFNRPAVMAASEFVERLPAHALIAIVGNAVVGQHAAAFPARAGQRKRFCRKLFGRRLNPQESRQVGQSCPR